MVNIITHISGSLMDHAYVKNTLLEEFSANVTVKKCSLEIMML